MRVLLIDDSVIFIKLVKHILTKEGYKVSEATNLNRALYVLKNDKPDLIILDIFLSTDHGFSFLKQAKEDENCKDIPVLVVSSINKPLIIKKALKMGAVDYINKPINIQDLKNKCRLSIKIESDCMSN